MLVVAGVLEAVWATALGRSEGCTRLVPSVVFGLALLLSRPGLGFVVGCVVGLEVVSDSH